MVIKTFQSVNKYGSPKITATSKRNGVAARTCSTYDYEINRAANHLAAAMKLAERCYTVPVTCEQTGSHARGFSYLTNTQG